VALLAAHHQVNVLKLRSGKLLELPVRFSAVEVGKPVFQTVLDGQAVGCAEALA
jgi:hypothetical protein